MSTLPKKDESVHEAGATAEDLGKESAVDRETKSATVAASIAATKPTSWTMSRSVEAAVADTS